MLILAPMQNFIIYLQKMWNKYLFIQKRCKSLGYYAPLAQNGGNIN